MLPCPVRASGEKDTAQFHIMKREGEPLVFGRFAYHLPNFVVQQLHHCNAVSLCFPATQRPQTLHKGTLLSGSVAALVVASARHLEVFRTTGSLPRVLSLGCYNLHMALGVGNPSVDRSTTPSEVAMRLEKKTALVTGATSGIGEAIAHVFAREGAQVVITGRNAQRGQAVVDAIGNTGGSAYFVMADLTSRQDIHDLVTQTHTLVGLIDILVNNAGIFPMGHTVDIDEATFDAAIATNIKAPFFLTAAIAPQMAQRGCGKIINITTVVAHKGVAGTGLYGATKAALTLLTKSWADEFGPSGVNVNALVPHLIRTPGTEANLEDLEQIAHSLPARRYAMPKEIAEAALYLASKEASYVHGVTLPVDGGYLAT